MDFLSVKFKVVVNDGLKGIQCGGKQRTVTRACPYVYKLCLVLSCPSVELTIVSVHSCSLLTS